jgi:hypothetical protein
VGEVPGPGVTSLKPRIGEKLNTSLYPRTEDAYTVLNLLLLNGVVVYGMFSLRHELRAAFVNNIVNNEFQREVNWMMTRTLEINCRR